MAGKMQTGVERQMTFSSPLDARQFLVNKITGEAGRKGVALSDVELRLLLLNLDEPESATGIPVEALEDTSHTYENKMARLLQSAYQHDRGHRDEQQKYKDAVRALKGTDHYILIIASATFPEPRRFGNFLIYLIIGLAMVALIVALQMWTKGK